MPFAGLTGLAFAAPITAWAATRQTRAIVPVDQRFVITPLFLFGGAFYPVDQLPVGCSRVAKATPMWHGVELCRDAVLAPARSCRRAGARRRTAARSWCGGLAGRASHVRRTAGRVITLAELPLRIVPPQCWPRPPPAADARAAVVMVNRTTWMAIVLSGFFEPLFYLLSIRVGFGTLVGDVEAAAARSPYAEFVAPALMAASAMNGAVYESTMNVFRKLQLRQASTTPILATPMTSADVALGEMLYPTSVARCTRRRSS